jgi:hypothetical protein
MAFRRTYLIVHGGSVAAINAKLVDSGMPKLDRTNDLPENDVKVIWNPQGFGSPDIKANSAAAYYPGDNYVDVVANDLYDYGLGPGIDHPDFVQKMASFVSSHSRVETIVYYRSQTGSTFDLSSKPKSRAAYKRYILPLGK